MPPPPWVGGGRETDKLQATIKPDYTKPMYEDNLYKP